MAGARIITACAEFPQSGAPVATNAAPAEVRADGHEAPDESEEIAKISLSPFLNPSRLIGT
jgi:hypothetical protein